VEALIKEHQGCSLLDVGCAEGLYVRFLSGSRRISIGMDISMPKLIRAKSHRENPESLSYILADACCLPFKDDSFDVVICVDVIRYLRDPAEAAKEMFRVSREHVIVQSGTSGGKLFPFGLVLHGGFQGVGQESEPSSLRTLLKGLFGTCHRGCWPSSIGMMAEITGA